MSLHDAGHIRLVVLNFNGRAFVLDCLEALHQLEWPATDLELVVVDNASTDGSPEAIAERYPDVRVMHTGGNFGFVALNRALTDLAGVRYVGLVNNDAFVEPGWLEPLVAALDGEPALGAASSRMVFAAAFVDVSISTTPSVQGGDHREFGVLVTGMEVRGFDRWSDAHIADGGWGREPGRDGPVEWTKPQARLRIPIGGRPGEPAETPHRVRIQVAADAAKTVTFAAGAAPVTAAVTRDATWIDIPFDGTPYDVIQNAGSVVLHDGSGADRGFGEPDGPAFDKPADVFAWCGGSVLLRPAYLAEVGLFDERFFLYYEDTDLSWRGQARGWRYRYVPTSRIRHIHAGTNIEGSDVHAYHVERNRLLLLTKNAPGSMVRHELARYVAVTLSYARRDILAPLLRGRRPRPRIVIRRIRSFAGWVRLLPAMLRERRRCRGTQRVPDAELLSSLSADARVHAR